MMPLNIWDATATTGSKLVYNWNYQPNPLNTVGGATGALAGINGGAIADMYTGDASVVGNGTLIVKGADSTYYVSPDKTKLIYTFTNNALSDGLYVCPIP